MALPEDWCEFYTQTFDGDMTTEGNTTWDVPPSEEDEEEIEWW
jgi:hypothetical protein